MRIPLFLLYYDNGLTFDDNCLTLLGIYATAAKREEAQNRMSEWDQYPFSEEGFFTRVDSAIGEEFISFLGRNKK